MHMIRLTDLDQFPYLANFNIDDVKAILDAQPEIAIPLSGGRQGVLKARGVFYVTQHRHQETDASHTALSYEELCALLTRSN